MIYELEHFTLDLRVASLSAHLCTSVWATRTYH